MVRKAVKRWEDNQITGIGRRNARTSFYKDSQKRMSLNGQWAFLYLDAPELSPEGRTAGTAGRLGSDRCTVCMAAAWV